MESFMISSGCNNNLLFLQKMTGLQTTLGINEIKLV